MNDRAAPAYMLLQKDDGSPHRVDISGPGGMERVAVGERGRRSSVWRIWANRNKSDVYVAVRNIAGAQKFSFHESGEWRHQWSNAGAAQRWAAGRGRIIDRWRRPASDRIGWTIALTIWVPHGELQAIPGDDALGEDVTFVREPPLGHVTALRVIVARPGGGWAGLQRSLPIGAFSLANGEIVLVLAAQREMTEDQFGWLAQNRQRGLGAAQLSMRRPLPAGARMALFGQAATSDRFVFDICANP